MASPAPATDQPAEVHDLTPARDALRRSSRRPGCCLSAVRVAPLNAHGCSRLAANDQRCGIHDCDGERGRTFRTDDHARGGDELGDIVGEEQVGRGELAETEVDHPDLAVAGEEDVRQPQIAMCDAMLVERGDLLPHRAEHVVGQRTRLEPVDRLAVHRVVGEHHRIRARPSRRRATVACGSRHLVPRARGTLRARPLVATKRRDARRRARGAARSGTAGRAGRRCVRRPRAP